MEVGCPDCGVIADISESSVESHNESKHDGDRVARPIEEIPEESLPDLDSIPTQYRDRWKSHFEVYGSEEIEIRAQIESSGSKKNGDCPLCDGRMVHESGNGTHVLVCSDCGKRKRDNRTFD